jgi:hypothetical protein
MITMEFRSRNYDMSSATGHLRMSVRAIAITWRAQRFIERRLSTLLGHRPALKADGQQRSTGHVHLLNHLVRALRQRQRIASPSAFAVFSLITTTPRRAAVTSPRSSRTGRLRRC